jgi:uncharacterized membrane protein (UPF0127 family)
MTLRSPSGGEIACHLAATFTRRFVGLMGRRSLPAATGLLFVPGGSIHTAFMRFPIDAVFINENGVVVDVAEHVRPWRNAHAHGSGSFVLELPAGDAERLGLLAGEPLQLAGQGLTWQSLNKKRLPSFRRVPGPQQLG